MIFFLTNLFHFVWKSCKQEDFGITPNSGYLIDCD